MATGRAEIYLHFIWTTFERMPLITEPYEAALYACIAAEVKRLGCWVYAIGGMPDHVHLVVRIPTRVSTSQLMQQVKGVSSAFARDQLLEEGWFRWQEGYGVFSISRSHLDRVIKYVEGQKRHHSKNKLWHDWETPDADNASVPSAVATIYRRVTTLLRPVGSLLSSPVVHRPGQNPPRTASTALKSTE